jgi:hypothetical protein
VSKAAGRNPKTLRAASRAPPPKAKENGAVEDCAVEETESG